MNAHLEAVEARDLIQATRDRLEGDERHVLSVVLGMMDNIVSYVAHTWPPQERNLVGRATVPGRMSFTVLEKG